MIERWVDREIDDRKIDTQITELDRQMTDGQRD